VLAPSTPAELADALHGAASAGQTITLSGNGTKRRMAGPIEPADIAITTISLRGVLKYEPRDLTISVGAGLSWRELTSVLAENRQMIPLDPPFGDQATVGGVVAANATGPRRRLYGTARDVVIGMQFATLEGKLVDSGGMVVKNVAGLDMAKLMIGSFGTLAAIATINFKVAPMPEVERSFLLPFASLEAANEARSGILKSQLQPAAIDLLTPAAGTTVGNNTWLLAIRVGGNQAAVDRYEHEFARYDGSVALDDDRQQTLWRHIENFTPGFLHNHEDGAVVRASCTLKELEAVMASFPGMAVARAGSGVCYGYFEHWGAAADWMRQAAPRGWKAVMEFSPEARKRKLELWPAPGPDVEIMKRVKMLFDPRSLLNRGRLYRRI
jgi:glycolate dehydrogenase FAD-binding subunit